LVSIESQGSKYLDEVKKYIKNIVYQGNISVENKKFQNHKNIFELLLTISPAKGANLPETSINH
jgi:hypothetical protein